jgi:integrase
LIAAGFLDIIPREGGRIFTDLTADKHGRETASFSTTFGRKLRRWGIKDERKTFHSFRHLFKDVLREHGVTKAVNDALTGHSSGDVAEDYGGDFYPLRPLVEAVELFEIHGLKD